MATLRIPNTVISLAGGHGLALRCFSAVHRFLLHGDNHAWSASWSVGRRQCNVEGGQAWYGDDDATCGRADSTASTIQLTNSLPGFFDPGPRSSTDRVLGYSACIAPRFSAITPIRSTQGLRVLRLVSPMGDELVAMDAFPSTLSTFVLWFHGARTARIALYPHIRRGASEDENNLDTSPVAGENNSRSRSLRRGSMP